MNTMKEIIIVYLPWPLSANTIYSIMLLAVLVLYIWVLLEVGPLLLLLSPLVLIYTVYGISVLRQYKGVFKLDNSDFPRFL